MACGGTVRGVRLLSPAGCARAWEEQFRGEDRLLGMPMRYGMGYGLFGNTYGWSGWGGATVMIEPDARMAVSYVPNQMREPGDDYRGLEVVMAAYDGLRACAPDVPSDAHQNPAGPICSQERLGYVAGVSVGFWVPAPGSVPLSRKQLCGKQHDLAAQMPRLADLQRVRRLRQGEGTPDRNP